MTDNNDVTVISSEFGYNGYGDGQSHNMYIGEISSFTLEYSYSHDANQGHDVKSRALTTHLLYNYISDGPTGGGSSEIDIPYGGASYLVGNVIEKAATAANHNFLTYNLENSLNAPAPLTYAQELYLVNNTFVNDYGGGTFVVGNATYPPSALLLQNNLFAGGGTIANLSYTNTTNLATNSPGFVNASAGNYQLAAGSPAINAGTQPGSANGVSLVPTSEYVAPLSGQPRPVVRDHRHRRLRIRHCRQPAADGSDSRERQPQHGHRDHDQPERPGRRRRWRSQPHLHLGRSERSFRR